ncbi:hypothetical protein [Levilactobacillus angrenensis]|uniref:hypothetical protein n=1 Tax=Levilactobacillus angrenensis TaxID=2486020 RepID=UPI000F7B2BA9|nr:hypothetical protein [Levilactobacillus angrenensis]
MKYAEFKKIAESEGFKPLIVPTEIVMFDAKDHPAISISKENMSYSIRSPYWQQVSPRMAAAVAEFAGTPWIERKVPDDLEDMSDD